MTDTLLILHGGWGAKFYPWDGVIAAFPGWEILIPDRTGYGRARAIDALPPRFHEAAALEMEALLGARTGVSLWGHSDGAIVAAIMALRQRDRYRALVLEAFHLERAKARSRAFFTMMAEDPDGFGPKVTARLADDHGDRWRTVLRMGGRAWLDIAATPDDDFFDHRLHELAVPTLILHGVDDPRTEPGELDRARREVPHARFAMIEGGGHAPHRTAEGVAAAARFFHDLP